MYNCLRLSFAVFSLCFLALPPKASAAGKPTRVDVVNTGTKLAVKQTSNARIVQQNEQLAVTTPSPGLNDEVDFLPHLTQSTVLNVVNTGTHPQDQLTSSTDTVPQWKEPAIPAVNTPEECFCNLTPNFCDIGCCCDNVDCNITDLTTVFTGCHQKAKSEVWIEKWVMFVANVEPSLITVSKSWINFTAPTLPALGDSYHFSPPQLISISHSRHFYRVDDVIQTYFNATSVRGLLRQPSPGSASAVCLNRNPARFLRSKSLSCTRVVTPESCTKDPSLNALSYYSDMYLIQIPKPAQENISDLLIPVTPLSDWPAPSEQNGTCFNVAKKVEFVIVFTDRGRLASVTVDVILANVTKNQIMQQEHSIQFKLGNPRPAPLPTIPSNGLPVGSSVLGQFSGEVKPITVMGIPQDGECSLDPTTRVNVPFLHNAHTGCRFSSNSNNCSELRSQISSILEGAAIPELIAMTWGSHPDWTRVLKQECRVHAEETCDTGCILPYVLTVQVLWAYMGLLDLPQSYILGVKYQYRCQFFQCPLPSPLTLTSQVVFADMTVYPKPAMQFGSP